MATLRFLVSAFPSYGHKVHVEATFLGPQMFEQGSIVVAATTKTEAALMATLGRVYWEPTWISRLRRLNDYVPGHVRAFYWRGPSAG